jgi:hypothetical protein
MGDTRNCDQCGTAFEPRREHGRFCSARCRVAWNRDTAGDRASDTSALDWSITAMRDATARLLRARAWDGERAFAVIGEAVWWVTIVDATLVRYYPDAYDAVLASLSAPDRQQVEGSLAGLRFVRNRMSQDGEHGEFIHRTVPGKSDGRVTGWSWTSLPEPELGPMPPRNQAWEASRYQAYEKRLAGQRVGQTFQLVADFLRQAAAKAA